MLPTHNRQGVNDGEEKHSDCRAIREPNWASQDQRATLVGLGLNKLHRRKTLEDTPAVRGMIAKVSHLVRIVEDA